MCIVSCHGKRERWLTWSDTTTHQTPMTRVSLLPSFTQQTAAKCFPQPISMFPPTISMCSRQLCGSFPLILSNICHSERRRKKAGVFRMYERDDTTSDRKPHTMMWGRRVISFASLEMKGDDLTIGKGETVESRYEMKRDENLFITRGYRRMRKISTQNQHDDVHFRAFHEGGKTD